MIFPKTNIEEKLKNIKIKGLETEVILEQVHQILKEENLNQERIEKNIVGSQNRIVNNFDFDFLETKYIYHINQIKYICIDYRLRFLDAKYFKGEIPKEAIHKIKHLEKTHNIEVKGFKIIAPSKLFKLEDKNDPLLLVPIGNDYFYLIHKWGNDLHPLRKLFMWPFKNIVNLTVLVLLISFLVTLLVPNGLFSKTNSSAEFWVLCFFMFKSIAAVVIYYGFASGKNFNKNIWRSRYFNN